ncbi:glycosyltransferase family 4 protein [Sporomusa termitida]|uniref:D-inositol 3-phosphate glycosyltransferase n=1 Tax=Sporomusa termitida TaxID=2377 RepID=A0A517DXI8_9FIRM|nr:glycosyltransferase family 1 protein [Sporomusa termitida]QDR82043.1 D-inositol 3-phosphate glycosyltransferase [Sporomusa termitida]
MRVVYDHQVFEMQRYGGISRYFYELISRMLRRDEASIALFMGFYANRYGLQRFENSYAKFFGIDRERFPFGKKIGPFLNKKLRFRFLSEICADIYHPTYYFSDFTNTNFKKIITVHDMIHELFPTNFSYRDKTVEWKKRCVSLSDGVICVSESTKKDLVEILQVPENKITVIYHGNSLRIPVSTPPLVKEPYILYVGERHGYKNFKCLVEALAISPTIRKQFKLVCFGGGKTKRRDVELLEKAGLTNQVLFASGEDEALANYYKYAQAFVYPSFYEGFGIPPLEAMYQGCPVVVSDRSSIPEVVGNAGLYFNPQSSEDLASKLGQVLSDNESRTRLIENGFRQEKLFSWDLTATQTLSFYKTILSDN